MSTVLEKCGLTTDVSKLKIKNRPMRNLTTNDLNLHHENMYCRVCINTWKVMRM